MNSSEQYLNYNEYRQLGGTLDIMPFDLLELKARTNIDRETQFRLKNATELPDEVKQCMFELIDGMAFDGLYKDVSQKEKQEYINTLIYINLNGVVYNNENLLYRGV